MEKKKTYIERLAVHGPKLLKNIFLILVGGVVGALNEIFYRVFTYRSEREKEFFLLYD